MCCGIWWISLCIKKSLGHECVMASDINEDCRINY